MSELKVNKISPRSGTTVTLGDSGDTFTIPSGVTLDASSGGLAGTLTTAAQPNITSVGTLTSFTSTGIDDNATSTAITIDSSGNLGIGTSSPSAELHISKSADAGNAEFLIENSFVTAGSTDEIVQIQGRFGGFDASYIITGKEADFTTSGNRSSFMSFWTRGAGTLAEAMRINSSGSVGIGTSSPTAKLQVEGTLSVRTSSSQSFNDSSNANNLTMTDSKAHFNIDGADKDFQISSDTVPNALFVQGSDGNVGIGTSSPGVKLQILGTENEADTQAIRLMENSTQGGFIKYDGIVNELQLGGYNSAEKTGIRIARGDATTYFNTNGSERMRINSNGNIGIGTTNSTAAKVYIDHTGDVDDNGLYVYSNIGSNSSSCKSNSRRSRFYCTCSLY
jgi:hypothetical protein